MDYNLFYSKPFILFALTVLFIASVLVYASRAKVKYVEFHDGKGSGNNEIRFPYQNPELSVEERVNDLMGRMTVAEKIGQMALIEKNSIDDPNDIAKYGLGALTSGGGGGPEDNSPAGWLYMVNDFQSYSQKTRLAIPLLYGIDANHGHSNVIGATVFPHSIGLAASKDPELVRAVSAATAEEVANTGINWIYSPDLDVAKDMRWGRVYETFGSDPELVGILGSVYIEGIQSFDLNGQKIAASAKHYVGNGSTEWGSAISEEYFLDQGDSNISEEEMRKVHIAPFKNAVDAGVKSVMVGLNRWNGEKVSADKHLISDILKGELGFQGFVVTDWYGVYNKESDRYDATVRAVNAGIDMAMLPYDYKYFSDSMHQALANGDIKQDRVDDAVRRILRVKFEIGLFDKKATDVYDFKTVGSEPHKELARKAVRQSLVLLKNNKTVPVSKETPKIFVSGSAADNIGQQSGGWTVEWQGIDGNWVPGTTILQGIRDAASSSSVVEYDAKGDFVGQEGLADIGIAVVGEKPYAEGFGDKADLSLSEEDIASISNLRKHSKKMVVIIVSGRPLDVKKYAWGWDAVIAAWLPGSEGQGVADVLFGDYSFTGSLPVEWSL
jgi:beta-glucosidase